jgi:hypothetical protein
MKSGLLRTIRRRLRALGGAATAFPAGHFYSPVVDPATIAQNRVWPERPDIRGIDFNDASHVRILSELFPRFMPDYDYPPALPVTPTLASFFANNPHFSMLDAPALFVLLRAWKPRRIIEVGSGFSTLLMADVNRRFLGATSASPASTRILLRSCGTASMASIARSSAACRNCRWSISTSCRRAICCSSIRRTSPRPTATSIFCFSIFFPASHRAC